MSTQGRGCGGATMACRGSLAILRLTPEAKLRRKKLQAFRRYLKDHHQQSRVGVGEHIGDYLIYGLALGVGAKVIERLFGTLSERERGVYLPWYVHHHGSVSPAEFAQSMTSVVTATTATVSSSAGAGGGGGGGGGGGAG
jgi:uncharacterized membrane protein